MPLKNSDLSFVLYVDDPDFDNEDNPYGEFKLHKFTNMNSINDT